jgi:dolichol kinase
VGPGPRVAATVPWNRGKTWWGLIGSFIGFCIAYVACFALPLGGWSPEPVARLMLLMPLVASAGALVESLAVPIDDNYVVGLSAPLLALAVHAFY